MEHKLDAGTQGSSGAALGALLVIAGIVFLALRFAPVDVSQFGWPLFVVLTGLTFLIAGLVARPAVGLVVPGSIVTMVGVILAFQNAFGLWASWSYAWALVFPTSVGIGIAIMGVVRKDPKQVEAGTWTAFVGLCLFAVFALFFEGMLRVAFGPAASIVFPLFLVALGFALLFASLLRRHTS
jgi:hypothetical protein